MNIWHLIIVIRIKNNIGLKRPTDMVAYESNKEFLARNNYYITLDVYT